MTVDGNENVHAWQTVCAPSSWQLHATAIGKEHRSPFAQFPSPAALSQADSCGLLSGDLRDTTRSSSTHTTKVRVNFQASVCRSPTFCQLLSVTLCMRGVTFCVHDHLSHLHGRPAFAPTPAVEGASAGQHEQGQRARRQRSTCWQAQGHAHRKGGFSVQS